MDRKPRSVNRKHNFTGLYHWDMLRHLDQLVNFCKDKDKKSYYVIVKELFTLWFSGKRFPLHYFTRYVYRKDAGYFKDYVELPLARKIWTCPTMHEKNCCALLKDKLLFSRFAEQHGIRTPKIVCVVNGTDFEVDNQKIAVKSLSDFKRLVFEKIGRDVFIKPTDGVRGKNCFKIEIAKTDDLYLGKLFKTIKGQRYIFQELIIQHPVINSINASSINTIRVDTYKDNDGNIHILTPFIRLGRDASITDNTGTGGFIVPVDLEKAVFNDYGIQYLNVGTDFLYEHPDSKVQFKNLKVPFAGEITALVKEIAAVAADRLVGWDVAISENGPLIVEGNCDYAMIGQDIIVKGYKRHPVFRKMLYEHGFEAYIPHK